MEDLFSALPVEPPTDESSNRSDRLLERQARCGAGEAWRVYRAPEKVGELAGHWSAWARSLQELPQPATDVPFEFLYR